MVTPPRQQSATMRSQPGAAAGRLRRVGRPGAAGGPAPGGGRLGRDEVRRHGRTAGSAEAQTWAEEANRFEPVLRTHDRYGTGSTRSSTTRATTG